MWLVENLGDIFQGRRLWLRPGKVYLFGRTVSEPGQLAISDKTISRKHVTITVGLVDEGDGQNLASMSSLTIEDLNTKIGTSVNGISIQGQKHVVTERSVEIKMGRCPYLFRVLWYPVALSFSFTSKELRADPLAQLRAQLQQLDIKFITDYDVSETTHVVSKKRNTPKSLQALINGKFIVTDEFVHAVISAASVGQDMGSATTSLLENDFDRNWPRESIYLPPRGEEPVERPDALFQPDPARSNVFEGYTFVFYERKQYENLLGPITNGKGKALLREAVPNETQIDEFIRYVKGVAGEKGLGEFEDGSEGRGVVVVRFLPAKGDFLDWFADFTTAVSLRLDHRPIEQREFLDAIIMNNASVLRKPLESEASHSSVQDNSDVRPSTTSDIEGVEADRYSGEFEHAAKHPSGSLERPGAKTRRAIVSRFKGFDAEPILSSDPYPGDTGNPADAEEELFVSQGYTAGNASNAQDELGKGGKRKIDNTTEQTESDVMDEIAPTAAAVKRQRIYRGEDPVPRPTLAEPSPSEHDPEGEEPAKPRVKNEINILDMARQHREKAEARALAENEALVNLPAGVNLDEIRRLAIVEDIALRTVPTALTRELEVAEGRWNPQWNGRKNFKQFRRRDEPSGRQLQRLIVPLEEAKRKEFGIGDSYWLQGDSQRKVASRDTAYGRSARGIVNDLSQSGQTESDDEGRVVDKTSHGRGPSGAPSSAGLERPSHEKPKEQEGKARSESQNTKAQSVGKRPASRQLSERAQKKSRGVVIEDSDESDDEFKFKFGRRH